MIFSQQQTANAGAARPARQGALLKLLSYTFSAWRLLIALVICIIATSLLELAVPWVMKMLLDRVIQQADLSQLPLVVKLFAGIFLAQKVFSFLQEYLHELANQRIIHKLRCDLYQHIERLPLRFFERGRTGEIASRITGDVDTVEGLLSTIVKDIGTELVMFIGAISFLFAVSPELTIYILPTIFALAISVFFFKRTVKKYARRVRTLIGEMAAMASETIAGVRVVKAFCGEKFEAERFSAKSSELLRARVKTVKLQSVYSSTIDICVYAGTIIVIILATPQVVSGAFTVGALIAYLSYLNKLYGPAKKLSKANFSIQKILAAGDRIFEIMNEPLEYDPELDAGRADQRRNGNLLSLREGPLRSRINLQLAGAVEFDRVSFSYDGDRQVLKEFSLEVAPGEMVALVGHSGGGKTTVVNLLLRFYRPTRGRIFIDRVPIEHISLKALRRQIGLVQQETFLFSGTLRDNIAYANPSATDEQVIAASRAAYAHDFIMQLPHGYLTEVGERGVKLSGGQRQRIAIARALLRNPRILIFDEATSHLDSESEQLVQQALERVAEGRTVFVIAHRLSTIWRADKIVVIEDGEIAQVGKHEELLACNGIYRKLYALQLNPPDINCADISL